MKILKYKIKNKKYVCDVDNCNNYAYAEMIRIGSKKRKGGWMYVCKKHYRLKLKRNKKGKFICKEKNVGFCILSRTTKPVLEHAQKSLIFDISKKEMFENENQFQRSLEDVKAGRIKRVT